MIPGSRGNLFKDKSFGESDNAGTKAFNSHAGEVLQAKEASGKRVRMLGDTFLHVDMQNVRFAC